MNFDLLKTFIVLAELKNFTKTAEQLNVVQSTVSSRIKELETYLGKSLFVRYNKGIVLTNAGEAFLLYAKRILNLQESAVLELMSLEVYADIFNVGSVHSLYDCYVYDLLSKYINANKEIATKITIDHSLELFEQLHDDKLDIAFTYFDIRSSKFLSYPFHEDEIILVAGPQNNINAHGISNDELRRLPLLYADILTGEFSDWFYSVFPKNFTFPLHINVARKIIPFLKKGLGYCFMTKSSVARELADGSLMEVKLLEASPFSIDSYMIINKNRVDSMAVKNWLGCNFQQLIP